jgi:hypothetical protein
MGVRREISDLEIPEMFSNVSIYISITSSKDGALHAAFASSTDLHALLCIL